MPLNLPSIPHSPSPDLASDTSNPGPNPSPAREATQQIGRSRPSKFSFLLPVLNGSVSMGFGSLLMLVALDRAGLAVAFVLSTTMLFWVSYTGLSCSSGKRLTLKTALGVITMVLGVILIVL